MAFCTFGAVWLLLGAPTDRLWAANKIWDGGGGDSRWQTGANWDANTAPVGGDSLVFTRTVRLNNTNNFPAGTVFSGISFSSPAGAFVLNGNTITLGGNILDDQVVTPQAINLALVLNATRELNVVENASLTLGGAISGSGGLTKVGLGEATLGGVNTFGGSLTIGAGSVNVSSDSNLGAVPGAAAPGRILLDGGTLHVTADFTINANRGIAVGNVGGGDGRIDTDNGDSLVYGGIIAGNGGAGGLIKGGFGDLTLSGANSYTGPTAIKVGTINLDFAAGGTANIINSASALQLGGENSDLGDQSFAAIVMDGADNENNTQTFSGTSLDIGTSRIVANSGTNGSATLNLGALTHAPGGNVTILLPDNGAINTTSLNVNGILGGFAMVSDGTIANAIMSGIDYATVDGSGKISAYSGYTIHNGTGTIASQTTASSNFRINDSTTGDLTLAPPGTGVIDINTLNLDQGPNGRGNPNDFSIVVGAGNTLRLGRFGGISRSDDAPNTVPGGDLTWALGTSAGGANGIQNEGILTAGGTDNTPGEIVFSINNRNQSSGSLNVEVQIANNGTGPVTVVKSGRGSMKFRGHNTYSGGTYIMQGRFQLAGSEIGTGNHPDALGTGPVYIFPGAQLFVSGIAGGPFTNQLFLAGVGTDQENTGAIRLGSGTTEFAGPITLFGDATLGDGGDASGAGGAILSGKISGRFNLDFGSLHNVGGDNWSVVILTNPTNDWTGDTQIVSRNNGTANSRLVLGADEVIPNGFGFGNLIVGLNGITAGNTTGLDLNGHNETVNGLFSEGDLPGVYIENNGTVAATLTVGDNDVSSTFGGALRDGTGVLNRLGGGGTSPLALTKIGGGVLTLTGNNTYTGGTTVNGGALALTGSAGLASLQINVNSGATLDVADLSTGFASAGTVALNNGTLLIRNTDVGGIVNLNLSDSQVRATRLASTANAVVTTLNLAGGSNVISVAAFGTIIASYPAQFPIIKYTTLVGAYNFVLGSLPGVNTVGFLSNNVANASIDLVLTDGPKPLDWAGTMGPDWDIATTANWLTPSATPSVYQDFDFVRFTDAAAGVTTVNLIGTLGPGSLTVSNQAKPYAFTGSGKLGGTFDLVKQGTGTLTLANTGGNDFRGDIQLENGTLQYDSASDLVESHAISGAPGGTLHKANTNVLTLSGANTYQGVTTIAAGTLRAGNGSALGTGAGATTVSSGATLDVNGQGLTSEPVSVSGAGVDRDADGNGDGAIVNLTGAANTFVLPNLANVTLLGNTVFGGTGRWDLRPVDLGQLARLSTGGSAHNVTKVGPNQVSFVDTDVDMALGAVDVQQGMLSIEGSTYSSVDGTSVLGNPALPLTVRTGATLQVFNTFVPFNKSLVLHGNGTTTTLNNGAGANTINSGVALNGNCVINVGGTSLQFDGVLSGSGGVIKNGAAAMTLTAANTYSGQTMVNGGTLLLTGNGSINNSPLITVAGGATLDASGDTDGTLTLLSGQTLMGNGTINSPLNANAGSVVAPGLSVGRLTVNLTVQLSGITRMELAPAQGTNDVLSCPSAGIQYGGTLELVKLGGLLTNGATFKLFDAGSYQGQFTSLQPPTPGQGQTWNTNNLATTGEISVVGDPVTPSEPEIDNVQIVGGQLVFSGSGGAAGQPFNVLSSTDVSAPLQTWTVATNGTFNAQGGFNVMLMVDPNAPRKFFIIQVP